MADGEITLRLDDATAARLRAAADAAGQAVEAYAAGIVAHAVDDEYAEAHRRLAEYDRMGESCSLEESMAAFDAAIDDYFAKPR